MAGTRDRHALGAQQRDAFLDLERHRMEKALRPVHIEDRAGDALPERSRLCQVIGLRRARVMKRVELPDATATGVARSVKGHVPRDLFREVREPLA